MEVTHSPNGRRLSHCLRLQLPQASSKGEENLQRWVVEAFSWKMPALIEFTLRSPAATELAERIMVSNSSSKATLYQYMYGVHRYCNYLGKTPDDLISECLGPKGELLNNLVNHHAKRLKEFVLDLRASNLAPGTISNHVKGVKALYRANGIKVDLPYRLSRRIIYSDRAPTQEELARIIEIADPRGKSIVSMLALGGFRVGTLCRLQYRHVREDLKRGIMPVHIHVEAEITKGGYGDYDTFLGREAVDALNLYLQERGRGKRYGSKEPEQLHDDSPLFRDQQAREVKPLSPSAIHRIVHDLLLKSGLIRPQAQRRYALRPHSIRKFFRTQLAALGVNTDYIDYMMGHKLDTYADVKMLGIEKLRQIYARSGFCIKPKTEISKLEMLKEFTRSLGLDPERILVKDALAEPHRIIVSSEDEGRAQFEALGQALKEWIRREALKTHTE
ncbi:MAG: site-specific integrase [Candidatus Bathyarchaeia archaeon]